MFWLRYIISMGQRKSLVVKSIVSKNTKGITAGRDCTRKYSENLGYFMAWIWYMCTFNLGAMTFVNLEFWCYDIFAPIHNYYIIWMRLQREWEAKIRSSQWNNWINSPQNKDTTHDEIKRNSNRGSDPRKDSYYSNNAYSQTAMQWCPQTTAGLAHIFAQWMHSLRKVYLMIYSYLCDFNIFDNL